MKRKIDRQMNRKKARIENIESPVCRTKMSQISFQLTNTHTHKHIYIFHASLSGQGCFTHFRSKHTHTDTHTCVKRLHQYATGVEEDVTGVNGSGLTRLLGADGNPACTWLSY